MKIIITLSGVCECHSQTNACHSRLDRESIVCSFTSWISDLGLVEKVRRKHFCHFERSEKSAF